MKQYLLLIFIIIISAPSGFCQNKPYAYIYESLDSIVQHHGYDVGKAKLMYYHKHYTIDPREISEFIKHSLDAEDISFYKKQVRYLSRHYGFLLAYRDTIDIAWLYPSSLTKKIHSKGLVDWTVKVTDKKYSKWASEHTHEIMLNQQLYSMDKKDQYMREMANQSCKSDSIEYQQMVQYWDYENFLELLTIYQDNDSIIPNPFDNGLDNPMGWLIIWHNLKNSKTIELTWTLLLPYIEKTYSSGKIGRHFFEVYDYWLNELFGEQYYGTLKGVPIRNPENFQERKHKYRL